MSSMTSIKKSPCLPMPMPPNADSKQLRRATYRGEVVQQPAHLLQVELPCDRRKELSGSC